MLELMKRIWKGWKVFGHGIVTVQNAILLGFVYFLGIAPVAVVLRLLGKPMLDTAPPPGGQASDGDTWWVPVPTRKTDMNWALLPF